MAALRFAARKLCGQHTAPVVVVGEQRGIRLLLTRLLCDRADGSIARPSVAGAATNNNDSAIKVFAARYAEFHKKREELYDLCAALNKDSTPGVGSLKNNGIAKLCRQLSVQIEPRPSDPDWRMYRSAETWGCGMLYLIAAIGAYSTCDLLIKAYRDYMSKRKARGTDARAV